MTSRRTPCPNPQIHISEEGAGVTRCCSPRLHPQIEAAEEGAEMSCRRNGNSPAAPASLPDDEDMLREILLRLPPQPSSLPRASAVCRRWRHLVADPKFHHQFRVHHRKPPLLGVFQDGSIQGIVFTPVLDPPDRVTPERFDLGLDRHGWYHVLDCRHGRVLVIDLLRKEVFVCIPITGEKHCVAILTEFGRFIYGAVVCAAGDQGHVHGGCYSSPFKVVLVSIDRQYNRPTACVYSSETGICGNLISTEATCQLFNAGVSATLVGNTLYWFFTSDRILKFGLDDYSLGVIVGPPVTNDLCLDSRQIIQADDGDIGFAMLSYPHFQMWQRNINDHGVATWVLWKTIEMHRILGLPPQIKGQVEGKIFIWGYDEDTDVIFVNVYDNVYMVQLKSMQSRKLSKTIGTHRYHLFKSFYTLGMDIAGSRYMG